MRTIKEFDYHRNGVCGEGFYCAIIEEEEGTRKLVVRFPKKDDEAVGAVLCAVFDVDLLAQGNIKFGENSWRGDQYSDLMDKAIERKYESSQ